MKLPVYIISVFCLAVLTALNVRASNTSVENDEIIETENDEFIRLNPELGTSSITVHESRYPFIRYDLNQIDLNGDDWSALGEKLAQSRTIANFTAVHIGDSHIQADGNTGTTRKLFQKEYGDAGRGIIIPFRLAGTNEPLDYRITSASPFIKATLMRHPWPTRMGFTGVSLHPETQHFKFDISIHSPCGYFTILADGDLSLDEITSEGRPVAFETEPVTGGIEVSMDEDCTSFSLAMSGNDVNIYGFDLRNDSHGVLYHAIGNNGAAFASYNALADFGKHLSLLDPDLVIISLGTNDAFGRLDDEGFNAQLAAIVRKIRRNRPACKILLTTPSECQKSVYTYTKRNRKGRRRRTRSYQVNANVSRVRRLILDFGKKNNIPVYDFYAVAGGDGASTKWLANGLLSSDRIHRTWAGYRLEGELIFEALSKALNSKQHKK